MKKIIIATLIFLVLSFSLNAQNLTWNEVSQDYDLPIGVRLFQGEQSNPPLKAWYLDVDMTNEDLAVRPYLSTEPTGLETVPNFTERVGAIAAVNGGFFGGSTSYSAVVYPDQVVAQNISALVRNKVTYPVTRSFFGVDMEKTMSVDWIYHFGATVTDIYTLETPADNSPGNPSQVPQKSTGQVYDDLLVGIGGGPSLVKQESPAITYYEEVFWESGVGLEVDNPRTAVGYTRNQHAILLVVDGRQTASQGVTLPELAQIMLDLGCVEAMNLDGGGSTQMAVGGQLINLPQGSTDLRAVPTILAVVHSDSIKVPDEPLFEKIIDTSDNGCSLEGGGWFPTANVGFWGDTPSMLNTKGSGEKYAVFRLNLGKAMKCELFAWWVAANNRCQDTPFIIKHQSGADTVRQDQTANGSTWNSLGRYSFKGDSTDTVIISNAATVGTYVVADAIRIVAYDTSAATSVNEHKGEFSDHVLANNYPNPFNSSTTISFYLANQSHVKITVHDLLGRQNSLLLDKEMNKGYQEITFRADNLSSGVYFYRIQTDRGEVVRKMLLIE